MNSKVVLVVASVGFQPTEYSDTKNELERAGINVITASNVAGTAQSSKNSSVTVDLHIDQLDASAYDGIYLIGGPGALEHLDVPLIHSLMNECSTLGKSFGAICISPRILAKIGLLSGRNATGWDGDGKLADFFSKHNVHYVQKPVVADGSIVTADGPSAAQDFGKTIARIIKK